MNGANQNYRDAGGENPSNMPMAEYTTSGGMQIDQSSSQPNWGNNDSVKNGK
jgi:hypothetical protein